MLVVMGTGSGKTMCILLPVFMEGTEHSTIIITPLSALEQEMKQRCEEFGISTLSWQTRNQGRAHVYVFAVEHIERNAFREFVRTLSSTGALKPVVVDEAHIPSTWDDFRSSLTKLRFVLDAVPKPVQRVLVSATVPPADRSRTLAMHGMNQAVSYDESTARTNLSFNVLQTKGSTIGDGADAFLKELLNSLRKEMTSHREDSALRIMIFVMRIKDPELVEHGIRAFIERSCSEILFVYHADIEKQERTYVHKSWIARNVLKCRVMICTSAFGAGVDTPNVRILYHFDGSASLVQFAQEAGRAGRDGRPAKCVLIWNEQFAKKQEFLRGRKALNASFIKGMEYENRKYVWWDEISKWPRDDSSCRLTALYAALDGYEIGPCIHNNTRNACDVCRSTFSKWKHEEHSLKVVPMELEAPGADKSANLKETTVPEDTARKVSQTEPVRSFSDKPPPVTTWRATIIKIDAKRVLRYLQRTRHFSLRILNQSLTPVCFSYSDWAGDLRDRKSTSGILVQLGSTSVYWRSGKQDCVTLSSTEAEHVALCQASKHVVWMRSLLMEFDVAIEKPTIIYEDNQGAITWGKEGIRNAKHVTVRRNYILEQVKKEEVILQYCPTERMVADILTKPLLRVKFEKHRAALGVMEYFGEKSKRGC